jgi:hypothetical protein
MLKDYIVKPQITITEIQEEDESYVEPTVINLEPERINMKLLKTRNLTSSGPSSEQ